jgi:transcriptional regulator
VLSLLARGLSNKEIARTLEIAEATTKIHLAALLRALKAHNRTEAVFKANQFNGSVAYTAASGDEHVISALDKLIGVGPGPPGRRSL